MTTKYSLTTSPPPLVNVYPSHYSNLAACVDGRNGEDTALLWQVVDQLAASLGSVMVSRWWGSHPCQLMVVL